LITTNLQNKVKQTSLPLLDKSSHNLMKSVHQEIISN